MLRVGATLRQPRCQRIDPRDERVDSRLQRGRLVAQHPQIRRMREHFDFVAIMSYPSRRRFLELAGDPEVAATIGKHRDAGLESQWLFAMTEVTE